MDRSDTFFVDYIDDKNINNELREFYEILNEENIDIKKIMLNNKEKYNNIDIQALKSLPSDYEEITNHIINLYNYINHDELNIYDDVFVLENEKKLNLLINYISQLEQYIEEEISILKHNNALRIDRIKKTTYMNFSKDSLYNILDLYNSILISSLNDKENVYDEYNHQLKIKKDLNKIYRIVNLESDIFEEKLNVKEKLKLKLKKEIQKIQEKITYLEDLMMENSIYSEELINFKKYVNELLAYDDNEYVQISRTYDKLTNSPFISNKIRYLESLFIKEREYLIREEKFTCEKIGIKNIKKSLDYISANYVDYLDSDYKKVLEELYNSIKENNCNVYKIYKKLMLIINFLWETEITDIHSYNKGQKFCFICTNNQFIDEKHEAILLTDQIINRMDSYANYQIGFVCNFNNNILFVTDNEDIMLEKHNDMSNVKTIKQIEQEYTNFGVKNKIVLNGFLTKIEAVYYIKDEAARTYENARKLANIHRLPLIELKKDKN